jgi:hypothetical protein
MGGISMADLSDTDKKTMFGENYKELELQAQIARDMRTSPSPS